LGWRVSQVIYLSVKERGGGGKPTLKTWRIGEKLGSGFFLFFCFFFFVFFFRRFKAVSDFFFPQKQPVPKGLPTVFRVRSKSLGPLANFVSPGQDKTKITENSGELNSGMAGGKQLT